MAEIRKISDGPPAELPATMTEGAGLPETVNVAAIAGAALCCAAAALYAGLFYRIHQLPAEQQQLELFRGQTPVLLQLVVLGASAGLLNLVALVLSAIGLFRRPSRWIAAAGTAASSLMLLSLASVILLGALVS